MDAVVVALGSGSKIKVDAVTEAFEPLVLAGRVRVESVVDAASGVRPQGPLLPASWRR